jgi:hypothetical protein
MSIYFSIFVEFFFHFPSLNPIENMTSIRTAQTIKISQRSKNERRALSSYQPSRSTAVAWVWIAGRPSGLKPHQTLGLRSIIPLQTALHYLGQGEKQCFHATHSEYRAFRCNASANIHLRLFESISQLLATQSPGC